MRRIFFALAIGLGFGGFAVRADGPAADRSTSHWAFQPLVRPAVPDLPAGADATDDVRPTDGDAANSAWPRNPIDRFVLDTVRRRRMTVSPEAEPAALLRRVTFGLTGLPPTLDELDAFLADRSPDAYERVVDRLLASPRYGERMAQHWLDLARYADTHDHHADTHRDMWRWRDWAIEAFQTDMPYDRFTLLQMAGDLLPDATLDQRIATGFHRNHMVNFENGAIPEEYRTEYVADRVQTTATVWLGLTLQCARCHDHKHDPLTQRDYYRLFAYFNNIAENGLDGQKGNAAPTVVAPTRRQQFELARLAAELSEAETRMQRMATAPPDRGVGTNVGAAPGESSDWERRLQTGAAALPAPPADMTLHLPFDHTDGDRVANVAKQVEPSNGAGVVRGDPTWLTGKLGGSLLFDGQTQVELADARPLPIDRPWTLAVWLFPTTADDMPLVASIDRSAAIDAEPADGDADAGNDGDADAGNDGDADNNDTQSPPASVAPLGVVWRLSDLRLNLVIRKAEARQLKVVAKSPIAQRRWQQALVVYDGSGRAAGVRLFVDGRPSALDIVDDTLSAASTDATDATATPPTERPGPATFVVGRIGRSPGFRGMLDDLRLYGRSLTDDEIPLLAGQNPVSDLLAIPADRRTPEQQRKVRQFFLESASPEYQRLKRVTLDLRRQREQLEKQLPTTMVLEELPAPRPAHVLRRGQFDLPGERVTPGTPSFLPTLAPALSAASPATAPVTAPAAAIAVGNPPTTVDRLALARWLVAPQNPLPARVAVNRIWLMHFGHGLVRTPDDFGTHGEPPTHPELLDWLASEWSAPRDAASRDAWSFKRLHRLLVTSAAYRQSSVSTPEQRRLDPQNRWLARGPRQRLTGEAIRDLALSVGGLLEPTIGGPSVFPYQPPGLWEEVAYETQAFTAQTYVQSHGADLYRRGLYVFWKRAAPLPALATFDVPDREVCTVVRATSNTPLQALVLMNETSFVEAARKFAERTLAEAEARTTGLEDRNSGEFRDGPALTAELLFRRATSRRPTDAELAVLLETYATQRTMWARDPRGAATLLEVGEASRDPRFDPVELAAWTTVASLVLGLDETLTIP